MNGPFFEGTKPSVLISLETGGSGEGDLKRFSGGGGRRGGSRLFLYRLPP